VDNLRVQLMALNDEACPLQLLAGRVAPTAGRHHTIWVDVRSLATGVGSFALATLVFDNRGRFKGTRDTPADVALATQDSASVELALDYSAMANGDTLVVAVKRVALNEGAWHSDPEELRSVATQFVTHYR
jgi:hypothetical protein